MIQSLTIIAIAQLLGAPGGPAPEIYYPADAPAGVWCEFSRVPGGEIEICHYGDAAVMRHRDAGEGLSQVSDRGYANGDGFHSPCMLTSGSAARIPGLPDYPPCSLGQAQATPGYVGGTSSYQGPGAYSGVSQTSQQSYGGDSYTRSESRYASQSGSYRYQDTGYAQPGEYSPGIGISRTIETGPSHGTVPSCVRLVDGSSHCDGAGGHGGYAPVQHHAPPAHTYQPPAQPYYPPAQAYQPPVQSYRPPSGAREFNPYPVASHGSSSGSYHTVQTGYQSRSTGVSPCGYAGPRPNPCARPPAHRPPTRRLAQLDDSLLYAGLNGGVSGGSGGVISYGGGYGGGGGFALQSAGAAAAAYGLGSGSGGGGGGGSASAMASASASVSVMISGGGGGGGHGGHGGHGGGGGCGGGCGGGGHGGH